MINQLLEQYSLEGINMPYTMEQFKKDYFKSCLEDLNPEEILAMLDQEVQSYVDVHLRE